MPNQLVYAGEGRSPGDNPGCRDGSGLSTCCTPPWSSCDCGETLVGKRLAFENHLHFVGVEHLALQQSVAMSVRAWRLFSRMPLAAL